MPNTIYKGHLLIGVAEYNPESTCWVAKMNISWPMGDDLRYHYIDGPANLFKTKEDAIFHGFMLAELWVDKNGSAAPPS